MPPIVAMALPARSPQPRSVRLYREFLPRSGMDAARCCNSISVHQMEAVNGVSNSNPELCGGQRKRREGLLRTTGLRDSNVRDMWIVPQVPICVD